MLWFKLGRVNVRKTDIATDVSPSPFPHTEAEERLREVRAKAAALAETKAKAEADARAKAAAKAADAKAAANKWVVGKEQACCIIMLGITALYTYIPYTVFLHYNYNVRIL